MKKKHPYPPLPLLQLPSEIIDAFRLIGEINGKTTSDLRISGFLDIEGEISTSGS